MDSQTWDAIVRSMEIEPDSLLYLHNLGAHRAADDVMKQRRILPFWGPKGLTDVWQPVDLNVGKLIKERIHKFMRTAQEKDGYVDDVDAKTKRRLFTQVISMSITVVTGSRSSVASGSAADKSDLEGIRSHRSHKLFE